MDFDPRLGPGAGFADWLAKHPMHETDFWWPERSGKRDQARDGWLHYLHNADVKAAYAASAAVTITLASLAASSTLLAGRESTAVDNGATNKYLDYLLAGKYRTGSANLQAGRIVTAAVGAQDDTPTWPDVFDGTDSAETITVQGMADAILRILSDIATDATQRTWPWGLVSLCASMGLSVPPDQFVLFVAHSAHTAANVWSATEGDHAVTRIGVYATVV